MQDEWVSMNHVGIILSMRVSLAQKAFHKLDYSRCKISDFCFHNCKF